MAATGYTPILIYASATPGNTPSAGNLTSSASGAELALNYADGKLFYKDSGGTVQVLAGKGGTGIVAGSNTQVQFNNSGVFGASANFTWDGSKVTASAYQTGGNLTFTGTGNRITGDFSNATFANRVAFQTSTTNANTGVSVLPNGTALTGAFQAYGNSDPTNSAFLDAACVGGTDARLSSSVRGTGTYLPMTFYTNGVEQLRLTTGGALQFSQIGMRITGDFSNATLANRVAFQTSTTNGNTGIFVLPNGTATNANVQVSNNSDPTNASVGIFGAIGSTDVRIQSATQGTGTYLPMTFYTVGSERMRIDTSGNVAVGTNSTGGYRVAVVGSAASSIPLYFNTDATNAYVYTPNPLYLGSTGAYSISFVTNSIARMSVDSSGNVSIGTGNLTFSGSAQRITGDFSNATVANRVMFQSSTTNSVTAVSAIPNGTSTASVFRAYGTSDPANSANAVIGIDSTRSYLESQITGTGTYLPLTFGTGGSERMRIDSSGNVGIGTASPGGYRLNVNGNYICSSGVDITPTISFTGSQFVINGNGYTGGISLDSTGMWIGQNSGSRALIFAGGNNGTSLTERMRIDTSGNVGIGLTSPAAKLDIVGASGVTSFTGTSYLGLQIRGAASTNDYSGIGFSTTNQGAPTAKIAAYFSGSGSYLQFGTSNSYVSGITNTAMTIDYNGNVGIGTSSPAQKLDVYGSLGVGPTIFTGTGVSTGDVAIELGGNRTGNGNAYIDFHAAASTDYEFRILRNGGANGTAQIINTGSGDIQFQTGAGNVAVTTASGLGYGTGSGGTVTQATSKSTAVTLNKPTGQITMNNAALAAGAAVTFQFNNSLIAQTDTIILTLLATFSISSYRLSASIGTGAAIIRLDNTSAGSLSEAVVINFAIIKGATS